MSKSIISLWTSPLRPLARCHIHSAFALSIILCSTANAQPEMNLSTKAPTPGEINSPSSPSSNQLVVVTTPSGALLSLDGQVIGPAPHTFASLTVGDHVVQAVWSNGRTRTTVVKVQTAASAAIHLEQESELRDDTSGGDAIRSHRNLPGYVGGAIGTRFGVNNYLIGETLLAFEVGKGNVGFALDLGFGDMTLVGTALALQFPISVLPQYGVYLEPGGVIGPEFGFGAGTELFARINPRLRARWDITSNTSIVGDLISVNIIPVAVDLEGGNTETGMVTWDSVIGIHYRY